MTLVWPTAAPTKPTLEAATHAFIVGVGDYPNVRSPATDFPEELLKLRTDLPSVTKSAQGMATWFANSFSGESPLGSIEMLLADSSCPGEDAKWIDPSGRSVNVDAPTLTNIKRSFREWYSRCNASEANVAFLFLCGHGVQLDSTLLLTSDYGSNPFNPYSDAVAFDVSAAGMARSRAKVQILLADCCREVPAVRPSDPKDAPGHVLISPFNGTLRQRDAVTMFASAPELQSYFLEGQPTLFFEAFLRTVNAAGSPDTKRWVIRLSDLNSSINSFLRELEKRPDAPEQRKSDYTEGDLSKIFHVYPAYPVLDFGISCDPVFAIHKGKLEVLEGSTLIDQTTQHPKTTWSVPLIPGSYYASAKFPMGSYKQIDKQRFFCLAPDSIALKLDVRL